MFFPSKHPNWFPILAVIFFVVSLSLSAFWLWRVDSLQGELARLSKRAETLDTANKKILAVREADVNMKVGTFLERIREQEAAGVLATLRKMFLLFPYGGMQLYRVAISNKEISIVGIASDLGLVTTYIRTLKNHIVPMRNSKLVSARQQEINGRKVHEFSIRCEYEGASS